MIVVALMTTHCMLLLVECKSRLKSRGAVTFADVASFTCGRRMAQFTDCVLVMTQTGISVVYLVFVSENLLHYLPDSDNTKSGRMYLIMMLLPVFIGLSWIRTLHTLSRASLVANIAIALGILSVLSASFVQIQHEVLPHQSMNVEWTVKWSTLPVMSGVAIYAFEGIGVVLPCETAMKRPHLFPRVVVRVLLFAAVLYCVFGVVPYLAFGVATGYEHGQITDNLHEFAVAENSVTWRNMQELVRVCLIVGIALAYPVQLFVATDICEEALFRNSILSANDRYWKENLFRAFLVMSGAIIAISVSKFGALMGLVGSFGMSTLQFVLPALFYLRLPAFARPTPSLGRTVLLYMYIGVGVVAGVFGTVQSVHELIS